CAKCRSTTTKTIVDDYAAIWLRVGTNRSAYLAADRYDQLGKARIARGDPHRALELPRLHLAAVRPHVEGEGLAGAVTRSPDSPAKTLMKAAGSGSTSISLGRTRALSLSVTGLAAASLIRKLPCAVTSSPRSRVGSCRLIRPPARAESRAGSGPSLPAKARRPRSSARRISTRSTIRSCSPVSGDNEVRAHTSAHHVHGLRYAEDRSHAASRFRSPLPREQHPGPQGK